MEINLDKINKAKDIILKTDGFKCRCQNQLNDNITAELGVISSTTKDSVIHINALELRCSECDYAAFYDPKLYGINVYRKTIYYLQ